MRKSSMNSRFINDIRVFATAANQYILETGEYLEDSGSGAVPSGWAEYISAKKWTSVTPIGGVWDMELNSFGITQAFGVHQFIIPDSQLEEIDAEFDDGNLSTGYYRKLAGDRYYYILEE